MKRWIIPLLMTYLTITTAYCQKQNAVRVELGSTIASQTIRIGFGHQIADRWSIAVETGMNIKRLINSKDHETSTHWNDLSYTDLQGYQRKFRDDFTEISFYAQYWPCKIYNGPVFSAGSILKDRSGADIIASIGYVCQIYGNIKADLSYNLYLIESLQSTKISPNGIRIGISYVF